MKLSPIKEVELVASRIPDVISLAQGIPSFDTPDPIKAFVQQKIAEGACAKYSLTPGLPQLREFIAESLLREGMHYDPEQEIIVSCGSIEAIAATLLTLTQPGDEVILPTPSYASYQEVVRLAGCVPRFAPLREEENFGFDVDTFERCVSGRTRAILYCNPNNPTGTVFSRAESLSLIGLAERHGLYLIIDEVYKDFVYTKEPYFSPAQLSAVRSRVIRVFSFSKAYGMTGWRVGFLHSEVSIVREILKVHDALVTCAPVVSQYAALAALEHGGAHIAEFRRAFKERRDRTLEYLDALSYVFDYQKPEGAYFVFPRVKDSGPWARDSRRLAHDILEKAKVALVPGAAFGPSGEAHLRINFGRDMAHIDTAFERLEHYFRHHALMRTQLSSPSLMTSSSAPVPALPRHRFRSLAIPYLQLLSRVFLRRKRPLVIAITGNRGKTVMKRLLGELLGSRYRVRTNPWSYNTEIGLPLAVLNLTSDTRSVWRIGKTLVRALWVALCSREQLDVLVVEFGVRQRGDMAQLLRAVRPGIVILTQLAPRYTNDAEFLSILQDETRILCRAIGTQSHFLVEDDDPLLAEVVQTLPVNPLYLHRSQWSSNSQELSGRGPSNQEMILHSNGRAYRVTRELIGESERLSVQAGVMLAERWTKLMPTDIERFLADQDLQ